MATDYDAPRSDTEQAPQEESLQRLRADHHQPHPATDADESEILETVDLPGADLSHEELTVTVLPKQDDEFTCSQCFLVHHRNRLAHTRNGALICRDCAD